MICEIDIDPTSPKDAFCEMQSAWDMGTTKVVVLRAISHIEDVREFYEEHFSEIGSAKPLAEDVDVGDRADQRTGEIWTAVRYDPSYQDAYRHSANAQPLHTDGSYIPSYPNATLMACVANAGEGGETIFVDGPDIVAALEIDDSDLLAELSDTNLPHARSGDRRAAKVINRANGDVWMNWNYYCIDACIGEKERALADRFFQYLSSSETLRSKINEVKLTPGDAVLWKDQRVLHGRNSFQAHSVSERYLWKCAIDVGVF